MESELLCFEYKNCFVGFSYAYSLLDAIPKLGVIVLPAAPFSFDVLLSVDGEVLEADNELVRRVADAFVDSPFWKTMQYDVQLRSYGDSAPVSDGDSKLATFSVIASCKLLKSSCFDPGTLHSTLQSGYLEGKTFTMLASVGLRFELCPLERISCNDVFAVVNYCMCTFFINIELQLPLVFGYYARKLYQVNNEYYALLNPSGNTYEILKSFVARLYNMSQTSENAMAHMTMFSAHPGRLRYQLAHRKPDCHDDDDALLKKEMYFLAGDFLNTNNL
ncbi:hypothetical protein BABINDRAFT_149351 [Babjeviella inositovora NRRL Y-12698]|uniref:Uncharacterized protein n=1 Tax=Babjeviella inositovora NRRL Y-12698 TaxID=984486 RepID=A0A1E3QNG3_9ASCO|nr:uncharacterized protein BABINDRAFT_149351 [Babjeviella inositovora NRRL Y-12698]ODQ79178.1 hypothetical protein BABINDRAFT_149351 [Babjeviella inositovora NRRL Y-12698]